MQCGEHDGKCEEDEDAVPLRDGWLVAGGRVRRRGRSQNYCGEPDRPRA